MTYLSRTMFMIVACSIATTAEAREWKAASGDYSLEAALIGFNDAYVILQREDKELGMLRIAELSEEDREYLQSNEAEGIKNSNILKTQTWTTKDGLKLVGRLVDYTRFDLTIQRRRGRMYVNDRAFTNLPEWYQQLLPKVIEHFDEIDIPNASALRNWLLSLRGQPRTFQVDGVMLELENGDEYAIPFFILSEQDRKILKSGWSDWLSAQNYHDERDDQPDDHAFRLESLAAAYFQNQKLNRQIALMDLNLQAIRAGLTSAWEVTLYPAPGNPAPPRWVVTLGRNSALATTAALQSNPGFFAGAVRRVSR